MVHEFFNLIIKKIHYSQRMENGVITVIYMEGDGANPENCRPIYYLQQLYKLFSTMLCNWLRHRAGSAPGRIQKDIPNFGPPHDVHTHTQKSRGCRTDMWVAAIDIKKVLLCTTRSKLEFHQKTFDHCCSNLRIADDVFMMASSPKQLKKWSRVPKKVREHTAFIQTRPNFSFCQKANIQKMRTEHLTRHIFSCFTAHTFQHRT